MPNILLAAIGAATGALVRLALLELVPVASHWITAGINIFGAFLIGALAAQLRTEQMKVFLLTGALGGFTTYSALAFDVLGLGWSLNALAYLTATFVGGVVACALGMRIKL